MTFLDALAGRNTGRVPIWFMRQAGRFLPNYLREKQGRPLYDLFHDAERIATITQLPIQEGLDVDAAILFSDILMVLDGLQVPYHFAEGVGPVITCTEVRSTKGEYPAIQEAIATLQTQLKVPLIGFAGGPFTLLSFLVEGGSSKSCLKTKRRLLEEQLLMSSWMEQITEETLHYLDIQIAHGVHAIQLFDSAAHHLSPTAFRTWALPPLQRILQHINGRVPTLLFSSASFLYMQDLIDLSPQGLSLYWNGSLIEAAKVIPPTIAVQGNLDPSFLFGSKQDIQHVLQPWLHHEALRGRWICNLGHGILPETPIDTVRWLIDTVHKRTTEAWSH